MGHILCHAGPERERETRWACWAFPSRLHEVGEDYEISLLVQELRDSGEETDPTRSWRQQFSDE